MTTDRGAEDPYALVKSLGERFGKAFPRTGGSIPKGGKASKPIHHQNVVLTFEPIGTAPKDRAIYAFRPMRGWCLCCFETWHPFQKYHPPYWRTDFSWGNVADREDSPTHWCELPSPESAE